VRILLLDFLRPFLSQSECRMLVWRVCSRKTGRIEVATSRIGARAILVEIRSGCQDRAGGKLWGACVLNYFARLVSWTHAIQLIVGAPWIKTPRFANKHAWACLLNCANPQLSPKRRR
jgi:hypothetical protein